MKESAKKKQAVKPKNTENTETGKLDNPVHVSEFNETKQNLLKPQQYDEEPVNSHHIDPYGFEDDDFGASPYH